MTFAIERADNAAMIGNIVSVGAETEPLGHGTLEHARRLSLMWGDVVHHFPHDPQFPTRWFEHGEELPNPIM